MSLDRNPFVASACEDITEDRLHTVTVSELAPDATTDDLDYNEEHVVTNTFLSMWRSLSFSGNITRTALLSVMRGIRIEQRHPAYRVSATGFLNVYQAQVGSDLTLVFKTSDDSFIWLAILHGAKPA